MNRYSISLFIYNDNSAVFSESYITVDDARNWPLTVMFVFASLLVRAHIAKFLCWFIHHNETSLDRLRVDSSLVRWLTDYWARSWNVSSAKETLLWASTHMRDVCTQTSSQVIDVQGADSATLVTCIILLLHCTQSPHIHVTFSCLKEVITTFRVKLGQAG